jgi:cell division septal protein FtsQ
VSVPVASDKRFRRAHVAPTRRGGRGSKVALVRHVVAAALALTGLYIVVAAVWTSPFFTVRDVRVDGNLRMTDEDVLDALDGMRGTHILTTDIEGWRARLKRSPWVADARVRRVLPSTVRVIVEEREPIGLARLGDALYLVDHTGTIIDAFGPDYSMLDLPVIDGLDAGPRSGLTRIDPGRAALAGRLLRALAPTPHLVRRISQIDVANLHDAAVLLADDPTVLRVGRERFAERIQLYVDAAERLRAEVSDIDYVDLRYGEHVYVRPRNGRSQETRAAGASASRRGRPAGE